MKLSFAWKAVAVKSIAAAFAIAGVAQGKISKPLTDRDRLIGAWHLVKILSDFELFVVPFAEADARAASALYPETKSVGLSLGDRACLALALREGFTVWTADSVWKKLKLEVEIELIRI